MNFVIHPIYKLIMKKEKGNTVFEKKMKKNDHS